MKYRTMEEAQTECYGRLGHELGLDGNEDFKLECKKKNTQEL